MFNPVFTDAGREAAAVHNGLGLSTTITHVVLGSAQYAVRDEDGAPLLAGLEASALQDEKLRVPVYSGGSPGPGQLNLVAEVTKATGADPAFYIGEVGFLDADGVLVCVWSHPIHNLGYRGDLGNWYLSLGLAWVDLPGDQFTVEVQNAPLAEQSLRLAQLRGQVSEFVTQSGIEYQDEDQNALDRAMNLRISNIVESLDKSIRTPIAVTPASGSTDALLAPTLTGSDYFSADSYTHIATQFEIRDGADALVLDSGELGAVTSFGVPPNTLATLTAYSWKVRYKGQLGEVEAWSDWSDTAAFTTADTYVATPTLLSPADNATDIGPQPVLSTSVFDVVNGVDTHTATQWQIATDNQFSNVIWDSGNSADLMQTTVPDGILQESATVYHLRVRHIGQTRGSSDWSQPITVTTKTIFAYIQQPVGQTPANNATDIAQQPVLTAAAYVVVPTNHDTHDANQWQVATDTAFSNLVWDSGVDTSNLASVQVGAQLDLDTQYYWRVRQRGSLLGWSDWSVEVGFTTRAVELPQNVFNTTLYGGNGTQSHVINSDLNMAAEGGLVIIKSTDSIEHHHWVDTERGGNNNLYSDLSIGQITSASVNAFSNSGFTLGTANNTVNGASKNYVAWSFREAPKFFDITTWTGDGVAGRQIPHNLGIEPGLIIVKNVNESSNWAVYHKDLAAGDSLLLNLTAASDTTSYFPAAATSTEFTVGSSSPVINGLGDTMVAYLFAHDSSASGIIQCGNYIGTGSTTGALVTLGWQPQYVLLKSVTRATTWFVFDSERGVAGANDKLMYPSLDNAELEGDYIEFTNTGFQLTTSSNGLNGSGDSYIYIAIRAPIPV